MTAEIAILNRSAIALAADSAVTIGRDRVWKNTNKLFHLSSASDVGVMIFGSGDFCGVPWDVLIKEYRRKIENSVLKTLEEYKDSFLDFLDEFKMPNRDGEMIHLYSFVVEVAEDLSSQIKSRNKLDRRAEFLRVLEDLKDELNEQEKIKNTSPKRYFDAQNRSDIRDLLTEVVGAHATNEVCDRFEDVFLDILSTPCESSQSTGVVFGGFGAGDVFPKLVEVVVDGKNSSGSRYWIRRIRDLNEENSPNSLIVPFAQADLAQVFMEGVLSDYITYLHGLFEKTAEQIISEVVEAYVPIEEKVVEKVRQNTGAKAAVDAMFEEFLETRQKHFIQPLMKVVGSLPKEEMAAMAEALVEITSLRRKMDSPLETVGGPVDVAVISKSDGFIWIKRKHYFDIDRNPDFIDRKQLRLQEAGGQSV